MTVVVAVRVAGGMKPLKTYNFSLSIESSNSMGND